jgi:hypothetical protein
MPELHSHLCSGCGAPPGAPHTLFCPTVEQEDSTQPSENEQTQGEFHVDTVYFFNYGELMKKYPEKHNEIALQLIQTGYFDKVVFSLDEFNGLDLQKIAQALRGVNYVGDLVTVNVIADSLENLRDENRNEIAQKLIEANQWLIVLRGLNHFPGLNNETVLKLINNNISGKMVAYNLNRFNGLDYKKIAQKLFDEGAGEAVADDLEKFVGLDHNDVAQQLAVAGGGYIIQRNMDKFNGLNQETALKLIEVAKGDLVFNALDHFQGLDLKKIAQALRGGRYWGGEVIADSLESLSDENRNEIAQKLIEASQSYVVLGGLQYFRGLSEENILKIIEHGNGAGLIDHLEKLGYTDHDKIVQKLIQTNQLFAIEGKRGKLHHLSNESLHMIYQATIEDEKKWDEDGEE